MITIIAKFNVLSGSVEEFKKCAVNVVRDTRKEKGNLAYKIYQDRQDSTKFTFIEEWLNDTAIKQHNNAKPLMILSLLQRVMFRLSSLIRFHPFSAKSAVHNIINIKGAIYFAESRGIL